MGELSDRVRIAASADVVYDLVDDPGRFAEWQPYVTQVAELAGRPEGIGTSFMATYRLFGRRLLTHWVITGAEHGRLLETTGTTNGGWAHWRFTLEPAGEATLLLTRLEYELPGPLFSGPVALVARAILRRRLRETIQNSDGSRSAKRRRGRHAPRRRHSPSMSPPSATSLRETRGREAGRIGRCRLRPGTIHGARWSQELLGRRDGSRVGSRLPPNRTTGLQARPPVRPAASVRVASPSRDAPSPPMGRGPWDPARGSRAARRAEGDCRLPGPTPVSVASRLEGGRLVDRSAGDARRCAEARSAGRQSKADRQAGIDFMCSMALRRAAS